MTRTLQNKKTKHIKESFEDGGNIDTALLSQVYNDIGVERCDALYANVAQGEIRNEMTQRAVDPMDSFVLGYRIREWTPGDPSKKTTLNPGSSYCYILYDSNNNAIDPVLQGGKCDLDNPIFQGKQVIKNVFTDNERDSSHALPYNKCVIEVDKEQVDVVNLNDFWKGMGEMQCANYQSEARSAVNNLRTRLVNSNAELKRFKTLDGLYNKCTVERASLSNNLTILQREIDTSNCSYFGACPVGMRSDGSLNVDTTTISTQRQTREELMRALSSNVASTSNLERDYSRYKRELEERNIALASACNDLKNCSNVELPNRSNEYVEKVYALQSITEALGLARRQYQVCSNELVKKESIYRDLISRTNQAKALYTASNSILITCLSRNDYLRQTVATLKDQVQKFATLCNDCTSAVVMRVAERDALLRDRNQLTQERDEWLRRCTYDQQRMLDVSVRTINQLRAASSQYTQQNCGNDMSEAEQVNNLIQKKFQALSSLSTPINCASQESQRTRCCATIGAS